MNNISIVKTVQYILYCTGVQSIMILHSSAKYCSSYDKLFIAYPLEQYEIYLSCDFIFHIALVLRARAIFKMKSLDKYISYCTRGYAISITYYVEPPSQEDGPILPENEAKEKLSIIVLCNENFSLG